jgi:hypothetical protein
MVYLVSQGSLPALPKNFNECAETPAKKARKKRRTQTSQIDNRSTGQEKANPVPSSDRGGIIEKTQRKKKQASVSKIRTGSPTTQCASPSTIQYISYSSSRQAREEKSEKTERSTSMTASASASASAASTSLIEGQKKTEKEKKKRSSQIVSGDGSAVRVDVKNGKTGERTTSTAQSVKKEKRKTSTDPTDIDENVSPVFASERAINGDVIKEPKQKSKKKIRETKPMEWFGGSEFDDVHSISDLSIIISPTLRREKESKHLKARTSETRTSVTSLVPKTMEQHNVCIDAAFPPDLDRGDVPVQSTASEHGDGMGGDSGASAYFINGDAPIPRSSSTEVAEKKKPAKKKRTQPTFEDKHYFTTGAEEKRASSEEKKLNLASPEIPRQVSSSELKPRKKKIKKVSKKSDGTTSQTRDGSTLHSRNVKQGGSKATPAEGANLNATKLPSTASNKRISKVAPLVMEAQDSPSVVTHSNRKTSRSNSVNRYATPPNSPRSNCRSTEFTSHKIEAPSFSSSPKPGGRRIEVANYAKQRVAQSQQKKRPGEDGSATTFPSAVERNSVSADGCPAKGKKKRLGEDGSTTTFPNSDSATGCPAKGKKKRLGEDGSATTFPSAVEGNSDSADGHPAKGKTVDRVCGKESDGWTASPTPTYSYTSHSSRDQFQRGVGRPPVVPKEVVSSKQERRSLWSSSTLHQSKSSHSRKAFSVLSKTRSTRSSRSFLSWNPFKSVKQMLKKRRSEQVIATDVEVPTTVWYVRPETALADIDGRDDDIQRVMNMTFYDTYTDESFKD